MSVSYGIHPGSTAGFFRVNNGKSFGPYQNGVNLYDTGYFAIDGGYTYLGVYKSADSGVTWVRQASGSSPRLTWVSEYYPGSGTVIYFAYLDGFTAGGNFNPRVCLASFDMTTDLLTIIDDTTGPVLTLNYHDANEPPNVDPQIELQLSRLSDGTLVVMYATINVFYDLYVHTYKAGVWAAAQQLNTNAAAQSGYQPYGIGVTTNDKIYCLWYSGDDGAIYSSKLIAGVLSSPVQAFPPFGIPAAIVWRTTGFYLPISDVIVWNAPLTGGVNRQIELIVLSGAGGVTPSFSVWDTTQTVVSNATRGIMDFTFNALETEFNVYYASTDDAITPLIHISLVTATTLLGLFGAPSVVWNYPTDTINPNYTLGGLAGPPLEMLFVSIITLGSVFLWGLAAQIPGTMGVGESGVTYFLGPPIISDVITDTITFTDTMTSSVTSGPGPNPPPQPGPAPTACILQS